ncbi:MAG: acetolactate synthase small subunit [Fusobacteriaceae bacterium]
MIDREMIILVRNKSGVLNRIADLFLKRGINIEGISIGVSHPEELSRITVTGFFDDYTANQLRVQANKLFDVISVKELEKGQSIIKELAFVKLRAEKSTKEKILELAGNFGAEILENTSEDIILQLIGEPNFITKSVKELESLGILEVSRTGAMGMSKGKDL